jgi:hypothetical protein
MPHKRKRYSMVYLLPATWLLLATLALPAAADENIIQHDLEVTLDPAQSKLTATDHVTLAQPASEIEFLLNAALLPRLADDKLELERLGQVQAHIGIDRYRLRAEQPFSHFTISYQGRVQHGLSGTAQTYAGGREDSAGLISSDGALLSHASFWYPVIGEARLRFQLATRLPDGWLSVSQGRQDENGRWQEDNPQDEIYLVAGPFSRYQQQTDQGLAQVYLRQPDPALAQRYLDATAEYLAMYSELLGNYPYSKFALVENFWQSGYGMPSFTLIGSRVIRLPFILHTSYPHEILHNWWGNGVFVDYSQGNWSEGLTAYLADHLLKQRDGRGAEYRRDTLQAYRDYVVDGQDQPLTAFRGHHGRVSQAIGYGKMLMMLHMLRQRIGDPAFVAGLRRFYGQHRFRYASMDDLRKAFEAASGDDLQDFFRQWTTRTGAPRIAVVDSSVRELNHGYRLTLQLAQTQPSDPFTIRLPIYLQLDDSSMLQRELVSMDARHATLTVDTLQRPLRLLVDPAFEVFRYLDDSEIPASLGQLFGARDMLIVLPAQATADELAAWRQLGEAWRERGAKIDMLLDSELSGLPGDRHVWLFGRDNRWRSLFDEHVETGRLRLDDQRYAIDSHAFALARRNPAGAGRTVAWLSIPDAGQLTRLASKLPHYGKYGYVVFSGGTLDNRVRGQWPSRGSVLDITLHGSPPTATLPGESSLLGQSARD